MDVSVINCPSDVVDQNIDLFSFKQTFLELNKNVFMPVTASRYHTKVHLDTDDG
jgi:hypothetical protein